MNKEIWQPLNSAKSYQKTSTHFWQSVPKKGAIYQNPSPENSNPICAPQSIRVKLKSRWSDGTESLLFTPSEFLERLFALIPKPKFHTTHYYGVLASRSLHRRYLPDKPTPHIDFEQNVDAPDSVPPVAGSSGKNQKSRKRKRISWAQLLKRTFKIDVLKCDKCGGRIKLVGVVFDQPTITTTLRALGLPVRAPPIAPARSRQLLEYDNINDWAGVDVDTGWPDERRALPHPKKLKTPPLGAVIKTARGRRVFAVFEQHSFTVDSPWFVGESKIQTYNLEELLGTKVRALYQRKKGRDLYDLWAVAQEHKIDPTRVITAFQHYASQQGVVITRNEFEKNLDLKLSDSAFCGDIVPLLRTGVEYNAESAAVWFRNSFLSLFSN